jgi:predicted N-acetyltransferase YhbS
VGIRRLTRLDDVSSFCCGTHEYDVFLRRYACINQDDLYVGKTHVLVEGGEILGYVTTAPGELRFDERPATLGRLPRYPAPILRLARLAVDQRHHGRGIGKKLVWFVLSESLKMNSEFGCVGVLVDALPDRVSFYEQLGFEEVRLAAGLPVSALGTRTMFLPTKDIQAAVL